MGHGSRRAWEGREAPGDGSEIEAPEPVESGNNVFMEA